jgi:hypothetical protein
VGKQSTNLLHLTCVLVQLCGGRGGGSGIHNVLTFIIADVYCVAVHISRSLGTWVLECSSAPCGIFSVFSENLID